MKERRAYDQGFLFFSFLYFFFPQFCGFENWAFLYKNLRKNFKFSLKKTENIPIFWVHTPERKKKAPPRKNLKKDSLGKKKENPPNSPSSSKKRGWKVLEVLGSRKQIAGLKKIILFSSLARSYIWPTKSNPIHEIAPKKSNSLRPSPHVPG